MQMGESNESEVSLGNLRLAARQAARQAPTRALARWHLPPRRAAFTAVARLVWAPAGWTVCLALFALLALQASIGAQLTAFWVYLNFDPDRGSLLGALVVALAAAATGALPWRRRGLAVITSIAGFSLTGVRIFLAQAYAPPLPGVPAQPPLRGWALVHALVVIYSLAAVCAAFGAGLGAELGDWVLAPLWRARRALVPLLTRKTADIPAGHSWRRAVVGAGVVLAAVVVCLTSVSGASDLLFYGSQALAQSSQPPAELSPATPQHGQFLRVTYTSAFFGGTQRQFDVYLPPAYDAPNQADTRYPVVYLLHGSPGNPDNMLQRLLTPGILDQLIINRDIRPVIVVAPDGRSGAPLPTQWMDSTQGHFPVESAFVDEVIPYVDAHYRTVASPSGRVIGGLSMGGFGAANLAIKHPDLFGGVIAMGAYFAPEGITRLAKTSWYAANSPSVQMARATAAPSLRFFLAAATEDKPYVDQTRAFATRLSQLNAHYTLQSWSGGHAWNVWEAQIIAGMRWFFGYDSRVHSTCAVCRVPGVQTGVQ
jgi:enterochelin esterase-like enzyme